MNQLGEITRSESAKELGIDTHEPKTLTLEAVYLAFADDRLVSRSELEWVRRKLRKYAQSLGQVSPAGETPQAE